MSKKRFNLLSIVLVISASLLSFMAIAALGQPATATPESPQAATAAVAPQPVSVIPIPQTAPWMRRHKSINNRVKQGNVDLLIIGDSITQGWEGAGKDVGANITKIATPLIWASAAIKRSTFYGDWKTAISTAFRPSWPCS